MVQTGFIILSVLMFLSIAAMINRFSDADSTEKKKASFIYYTWCLVWIAYLIIISRLDLLANFDFPPRIPLLLVFPLLISIFIFVSLRSTKRVLSQLTPVFPVYIQSFRVFVEILIYGAFLEEVLPKAVTFEGTNFDILLGLSAPAIAFMFQKNYISKRGVLIWNVVGLSILGLTVYTFISTIYFSGMPPTPGIYTFVELPYVLLPGFLLPCAIFYHVISIKQMTHQSD